MKTCFAGLDVSRDKTAICIVDDRGAPIAVCEAETSPAAIAAALRPHRRKLSQVAHETGPFAPWLHKELLRRRYPIVCLDARQVRAALAAQRNKTDRNDARDIAIVISRGFKGVTHVKSDEAHRVRMLLTCRRALKRRARDLEFSLRSCVKAFGMRAERRGRGRLVIHRPRRTSEPFVDYLAGVMMRARQSLLDEIKTLDARIVEIAEADPVCRRLMTTPGVGPITALTFKSGVDDPARFPSSRDVGAHFGLTPRRRQSGLSDFSGGVSKSGDSEVRAALYDAAAIIINRCKRPSALLNWAHALKARKGFRLATVACARKLAVVLHRMWITGQDFDPARPC